MRRSGATMLADSGISKITLKRAGRWKSDTVCDGYVDESKSSKIEIANALGGMNSSTSNFSSMPSSTKNVYIQNITGNVILSL
jgi:hypothetical protein